MEGDFDSFKEQVKSAVDMVDVISGYVSLKKRGQNYWGCCPFHGEKTPSFSVNPGKSMFYCFGCHEGGDIFKFIMKIENCGFMDALKLLASRYGIPVPERQKTAAEIEREKQRNGIYNANELASRFYQACLLRTAYGKQALAYLAGRGITQEIIERFTIGYALDNFTALTASLGKRGCAPELLVQAGLVAEGGRSGFYDKFRNRVMIPIKDSRGRIVGFGGRVLDNSTPKYLNTSETQWFNKRRLLFGLDIAARAIRKSRQAIIVEGYMDAISLHAAGIDNAVASMGTAFAEEQARLLKRMTEEAVFCYDSDSAGRKASVRAVSIALAAGLKVRIAGVPEGKDPDEFVRHHGREAFLEVIARAQDGIAFQINETLQQNNLSNLAGKVEAVSNILPFLRECKTEIEASEHIRRLAQQLTIDEGLIMEEYRKATRGAGARRELPVRVPQVPGAGIGQQAEEFLLCLLLERPDLCERCEEIVEQTGFTEAAQNDIFVLLQAGCPIDKLCENLDSAGQSLLARLLARPLPEGDSEKLLEDCLRQLQRSYLEKEYAKHSQLAQEYERLADERFISELMESQRIKNEIKKLYGN